MFLTRLETGDEVHRYQKALVVSLAGRRRVLSTGPINGGLSENLTAVFNHDGTRGAGMAIQLKAPTYAEHMVLLSRELGLDPDHTTGISTAAQMENVSIKTERYKDIAVTAVVTGGVETNGGRAGDPASWDELSKKSLLESTSTQGTINIMLFISVDLTESALTRSLVTCTEAKTAALQELAAPSRYSRGLATGSGTDGTIIVANAESPLTLENSGKHVKLGELIGRAVKAAVKEALKLQSGLVPARQHDVLKRVDRFGITAQSLWSAIGIPEPAGPTVKAHYALLLEELLREGPLVTAAVLYAHLMDQVDWALLSPEEVTAPANALLEQMGVSRRLEPLPEDIENTITAMTRTLEDALAELLRRKMQDRE